MTAFVMSTATLLAALLLWGGLAKLTNIHEVSFTIQSVGVSSRWANGVALVIAFAEVLTAFSVLFAPAAVWTVIALLVLGTVFAGAGGVALWRDRRIRCNCFGAGDSSGYLGLTQIATLPAWVGCALMLRYGLRAGWSSETSASLIAVSALLIAVVKMRTLWLVAREGRADRIAAQEMYLWLPQH